MLLFAALFTATYLQTTTSYIIPPVLQQRQAAVCGGDKTLSQCGGDFPSSFCCPTGTTCYGFNSDKSVICCPEKECPFINTLSCDPSVYDATVFPASPIHMTNLSSSAYTPCGSSNTCCPTGYSCGGGGCQRDSVFKGSNSTSPGASATASATLTATPSIVTGFTNSVLPARPTSTTQSGTNQPVATTAPSNPQFPIEAVLVGLLPGLAGGILLAFLIVCCVSKRKARKLSSNSTDSLGPTIAKISDPIYTVDPTATRTDFLRAGSRLARKASRPILQYGNKSPSAESSLSRMRSLFKKTPRSVPNEHNLWGQSEHPMPDPTYAAERALDSRLTRSNTFSTTISSLSNSPGPRTPKPRREPSMESIPIYNNTPDAQGYHRDPMFADLLPAVSMSDAEKETSPKFTGTTVRSGSVNSRMPLFLGSPLGGRRLA